MRSEQVDLLWWSKLGGRETAAAFVLIDEHAVPERSSNGHGIDSAMRSLWLRIDAAVESASAIVLGSSTLVSEEGREISSRAQRLAHGAEKPIVFDVDLHLQHWRRPKTAVGIVKRFCEGALLVKLTGDEARLLTGENDPASAAELVCSVLGARIAVVMPEAGGAFMRGEVRTDVDGKLTAVVDPTGAGDALTGVLVAALAAADFDPNAAARALPLAVEIAARATEGIGATAAPPRSRSRARVFTSDTGASQRRAKVVR